MFACRVGLKTQPESKCPELLANYCDMLLRKTPLSKKLTSEEIELKLKEVVSSEYYCFVILLTNSFISYNLFSKTSSMFSFVATSAKICPE